MWETMSQVQPGGPLRGQVRLCLRRRPLRGEAGGGEDGSPPRAGANGGLPGEKEL